MKTKTQTFKVAGRTVQRKLSNTPGKDCEMCCFENSEFGTPFSCLNAPPCEIVLANNKSEFYYFTEVVKKI